MVGPEYFSTMGIEVIGGREFVPSDRRGGPVVAVINEEFARRHFAGEIRSAGISCCPASEVVIEAEIVGVVRNGKYRTIGEDQSGAVYEPFLQRGNRGRFVHVLVRASAPSETVRADIERVLSSLDPTAAVDVKPMSSSLAFAFLPSQIGAALLGALGAAGLALAVVGLYATMAYSVSRRTAEIGIRMALGATTRGVMLFVLKDAATLAVVGIAIGLAAAAFLTQPLGAFLVAGLSAADPLTFAVDRRPAVRRQHRRRRQPCPPRHAHRSGGSVAARVRVVGSGVRRNPIPRTPRSVCRSHPDSGGLVRW